MRLLLLTALTFSNTRTTQSQQLPYSHCSRIHLIGADCVYIALLGCTVFPQGCFYGVTHVSAKLITMGYFNCAHEPKFKRVMS